MHIWDQETNHTAQHTHVGGQLCNFINIWLDLCCTKRPTWQCAAAAAAASAAAAAAAAADDDDDVSHILSIWLHDGP